MRSWIGVRFRLDWPEGIGVGRDRLGQNRGTKDRQKSGPLRGALRDIGFDSGWEDQKLPEMGICLTPVGPLPA
jgi:hypothetical protein